MRRRDLVGAAIATVVAGQSIAQEPGRTYRVGYLGSSVPNAPPQAAFVAALRQLGFVEGENLVIDRRGFGLKPEQFVQVARDVAEAKPDLIVCGGPDAGRAAQQATKTIPLLINTDDMVGEGLVGSIAHPGGNTTGVSIHSPDLDGKRLEILIELIPGTRRLAALGGSDTANPQHYDLLRRAARARDLDLSIDTVASYGEIGPAIDRAKAAGAEGLNVLGSALLFGNRKAIFERAAALRLPAIYQWQENAHEGGLAGYGPSIVRIYGDLMSRQAARILRGANPANLPVEQPDKFELALNLQAAKALGLAIPEAMIARADEIIE